MAELPIGAPKPAASAAAVHPYACAAAALLAANEGRGSTIAATPCRSKGPPCSQASHGLATALQWRAVLPKIRYSLAGQDTRLSPEAPGFESRWRNCFVFLLQAQAADICKFSSDGVAG